MLYAEIGGRVRVLAPSSRRLMLTAGVDPRTTLHLGFDGWQRVGDRRAERNVFGLWAVTLIREELGQAQKLNFTRRYENRWENFDHWVELETRDAAALPQGLRDAPQRSAA